MNRLAIVLYTIAGIILPILAGLYHTFVHFKALTTPSIESYLQKPFDVMGFSSPIWNSWGMMSFMMGMAFIVMGLLNINILKDAIRSSSFSFPSLLSMIIFYCSVIYVGQTFDAQAQFIGGFIGIAMILISYFTSRTASKIASKKINFPETMSFSHFHKEHPR